MAESLWRRMIVGLDSKAMKDIISSILIVVAILLVCATYFKLVIQRWLASDSVPENRPASEVLPIETVESEATQHSGH